MWFFEMGPNFLQSTFCEGGGSEALELPPVELFNLSQIAKVIGEVLPFDKDRLASIVVRNQNYIRKLVKLFRTCEDLENDEGLQSMFRIVKGLISLNDGHIFDIIFSDEYIMDIVGALEYDPGLPIRQNHRTYLLEHVNLKEVVPIHDSATLSKIHQAYRIGYIKDIILPRALDDQTFATMNSIILFNNVSVVSALQNDLAFLSELFSRLRSLETSKKNRRDLVFFVQELCNLKKHPQPAVRSQLFSALVKEGLLDIMKDILKDTDETVQLSGCDILTVIMNNDPALLRGFLVQQAAHTLFSELVSGMVTQSEGGLQAQLLEIIRMLLDSETMEASQVEKSPFLEVFYEKYMDQIVEVLISGCPPEVGVVESSKHVNRQYQIKRPVSPEILGSICDLLCFCVQHHRFRIKYYVIRKHVVEKVLRLTRRKEKYLVVAAVRFLKTCIFLKEEFYHRYIVKNNWFEPIISAFVANGTRYNLLNSAVLELIERIRKDGIKSLIVHLIETYSSELGTIDYVNTFQALKLKYDQMMESPSGFPGGSVVSDGCEHGYSSNSETIGQVGLSESRKRKVECDLDKDEEDHINEDSDDEEDKTVSKLRASSNSKSLSAGSLNKSGLLDQKSPSNVEDTTTAKLRTAGNEQPTKAVILVSQNHVPFRGKFGLVDYEDEEDELPMNLGSKRKDGDGVLVSESDRLLAAVPLSDPIWSNMEDATVAKRKSHSGPDLDQNHANCLKKQRSEMVQETGDSNDSSNVTCIDDLDKLTPSVTGAETRGVAESTNCFQVSASSENPVSKPDSVKIFPFEEPRNGCQEMLALPAGNAIVVDRKTFDSASESDTTTNHVDGGDSGSIVDTDTAGSVFISNGKVSTFSRSANCVLTVAKDKQNVMNGAANSLIEQSSSHKEEVSTSPG
uniref:Serine/threonine-protein phosphatase 4 regulatory subunit 3-like central domain-containing protein n=1 Tax=Physcomitrium patens TaxID=3218 RepID=A0A7I4D3Y0_PHYPA